MRCSERKREALLLLVVLLRREQVDRTEPLEDALGFLEALLEVSQVDLLTLFTGGHARLGRRLRDRRGESLEPGVGAVARVLLERGLVDALLLDRGARGLALPAQALDLFGQRPQPFAPLAEALLAEHGVALAGDALVERRVELLFGARDGGGELALALDDALLLGLPLVAPPLDLAGLTIEAGGLLQVRLEPLGENVEAAAPAGARGRDQLAPLARRLERHRSFVEAALERAVALEPLLQLVTQALAARRGAVELGHHLPALLFEPGQRALDLDRPLARLVDARLRHREVLAQAADALLELAAALGLERAAADQVLEVLAVLDQPGLDRRGRLRDLAALAATSESAGTRVGALHPQQAPFGDHATAREERDAVMDPGQPLGVLRGRDQERGRQALGVLGRQAEALAQSADHRRVGGRSDADDRERGDAAAEVSLA